MFGLLDSFVHVVWDLDLGRESCLWLLLVVSCLDFLRTSFRLLFSISTLRRSRCLRILGDCGGRQVDRSLRSSSRILYSMLLPILPSLRGPCRLLLRRRLSVVLGSQWMFLVGRLGVLRIG